MLLQALVYAIKWNVASVKELDLRLSDGVVLERDFRSHGTCLWFAKQVLYDLNSSPTSPRQRGSELVSFDKREKIMA